MKHLVTVILICFLAGTAFAGFPRTMEQLALDLADADLTLGDVQVNSLGVGTEAPASGISCAGDIVPSTNEGANLGTSAKRWNVIRCETMQPEKIEYVGGTAPTLTYGADFGDVANPTANPSSGYGRIAYDDDNQRFYLRDSNGSSELNCARGVITTVDSNLVEVDNIANRDSDGPPDFTYCLLLSEIAEPSNPASGKVIIYPDSTTGDLMVKFDSGAAQTLVAHP